MQALIFDLDGLMLDTEPLYQEAWRRAARELGFELDRRLYRSLIGRNSRDSIARLKERWGDGFSEEEFKELWTGEWNRLIDGHGIPCKPGLDELLAWADDSEIRRGVATSSARALAERNLSAAGLAERFEVLVPGDEVTEGKPAPEIYRTAARALEVGPEETIALEDSNPGVHAAARAGCTVLMVPDQVPPTREARDAADGVFRSLHEVRTFLTDNGI